MIKILSVGYALIVAIVYIIGTFIAMNFDPFEWTPIGRWLAVGIFIFTSVIFTTAMLDKAGRTALLELLGLLEEKQ